MLVKQFEGIGKNDASTAGGKGASLGEMTQVGIPVPSGFVILAAAFERFLREAEIHSQIDAILHKVDHRAMHTVEQASEEIKALILNAEMPKNIAQEILTAFQKLNSQFVAVRSSATAEDSSIAAWAGQLESYLNTTKDSLLENVKKCWASLFTPRAIFYRFEQNLHEQHISVAVVVQKMVESEVSGIGFSVHPVTQDYNQLIIEAGLGLGEAIVSGQITPDSYVIEKKKWEIIEKNISPQTKALYQSRKGGNEWEGISGNKQKISDSQIIELARLIVKIEQHYGFPVDVEWALEKGKFYIVQSRPITTLIRNEGQKSKTGTLTNIFSREKSLIYFCTWNESDRKGVALTDRDVNVSLFIVPPKGEQGSVWYEKEELQHLKNRFVAQLKNHKNNPVWDKIKNLSNDSWAFLEPYATGKKIIENPDIFVKYYENLVDFWTCLNSFICEILENENVDKNIRNELIDFRIKTERYTEKMSSILTDYLRKYPPLQNIANIVTKEEALNIIRKKMSSQELNLIKARVNGCFMFNDNVYTLDKLEAVLNKNNISLEQIGKTKSKLPAELLPKDEYLKTVKRPYPPLFTSLVCMGYPKTKYFQEVLKKPYAFPNMAHVDSIWYYAKKEVEEGGKIALESWKDKDFFENVKKIFKKREDELVAAAKKNIKSYCNAYMKYMPPLALVFAVEKPTETRLRDALSKKLSAEKVDELMSELNIPLQDNFYKKEEYDLVMAKDLAKHVKIYEWILARYGEERKYTLAEAREKLKHVNKVEFLEKLEEDKRKLQKTINGTKKMLGSDAYLVDIFQYIIYYRTQRTDIMNKSGFLAIPMFKRIAESLGLTYRELLYCSASELLENKIPSKEILKMRMEDCSTILYNGHLKLFTGRESEDIKEYLKEEITEIKEIKGSVACKGNVRGKVKVVLSKNDFDKIQQGDILVTSMTTPEMIPLMKKAVAFVTDEGGVTSHAAIVSREMKKPCIIGTKFSTKVLKDGMLIEVNANEGTVKILDQNKQSENWLKVVSFKTELLTESIIHHGYRESLPTLIPNLPPFRNRMIIDNDIYIDLNETGKIQEYFSQDTIKKASEAYDAIEKQSIRLIELTKSLVSLSLSNLSNDELSHKLELFFKEYQKTIGAIGVPTVIDLTLESKLKNYIKESGIKNIQEALSSLAIPYKPVQTTQEIMDLLNLAVKINNEKIKIDSNEFKSLVKKHYEEYGWLHSTLFLGEVYDEKQIREELIRILKDAKSKRDKLENERKEHEKEANSVIEKIKNKEGKRIARFFQKAVYYRTVRLEWMNKACFIVRPLLEEAAMRLNVIFYDLIYLMPNEIKDSLIRKDVSTKLRKEIKQRHKGYAYISDNKDEYILVMGKELEALQKRFSKEHKSDIVKGIVAYKGNVKGRAVIVRDRSELHKVENGSILVTPLTTPDFIMAMRKSAGIVTDLGGVTSHAAIVSRELKIPCIVGTGNATKVLKDGDLVELDADEGTVRIVTK